MYIAQKLRKENIIEYLLYLWQVEDLLRANELDMKRLDQAFLSRFQVDEEQKKTLYEWYENLIVMMREENVTLSGHLQINKNVLINLSELHHRLLNSPKFPFYSAAYYKALPFIVELRGKNGETEKPELETCLEALYGVLLLRMQGKEIHADTQKAVDVIRNLLSMLANYHTKEEAGELELE